MEQQEYLPFDTPNTLDAVLHFLNAKWYTDINQFLSSEVDWFAIDTYTILPREKVRAFIRAIKDIDVRLSVLEFLAQYGRDLFRDREVERIKDEDHLPDWGKPSSKYLMEVDHQADVNIAAFETELKLQINLIKTAKESLSKTEEQKEDPNQETDARVLLRYITTCADSHNPAPPMLVLKEAIALLDKFRSNPDDTKTAWDYIKEATEHLASATKNQYWRQTPGYQVAATMYILMRVDGFADIREESFANEIYKILIERHNFNFNKDDVEMTITGMQKAKNAAPPTINPFVIVDELANSTVVSYADWLGLLSMLNKMMFLMGKSIPHYMVLHMFLTRIPDTMRRVDILGHLQDAAEQNWPKEQAEKFITQADYLVHIYKRIHTILIEHPIQKIWDDQTDMDELTMFIQYITPEEMVAIAQSIYDTKERLGQRIGMVQHILRHKKYIGKLVAIDSLSFCKSLYMAHGFCMLMKKGKEDFRELPSIDNLDCEFRNACFDVYINLRLALIKEKLKNDNRRLYPADNKEAYTILCKSLKEECDKVVPNAHLMWEDERAMDSMVAAMQLLSQYAEDKKNAAIQTKELTTQQSPTQVNLQVSIEKVDKIESIEHLEKLALGDIVGTKIEEHKQ